PSPWLRPHLAAATHSPSAASRSSPVTVDERRSICCRGNRSVAGKNFPAWCGKSEPARTPAARTGAREDALGKRALSPSRTGGGGRDTRVPPTLKNRRVFGAKHSFRVNSKAR